MLWNKLNVNCFLYAVDEPSLDPNLKQGRSTALFVALKENASYVYTANYCEKINRTLISHLQASKVKFEKLIFLLQNTEHIDLSTMISLQVPIVLNGIRGCGYLFLHLLQTNEPIPSSVLVPFARVCCSLAAQVFDKP